MDDTVQGTTDGSGRDRIDDEEALRRGDFVGRYVVLEKLGAGGMGVVYAAYDPDLDRRVAVKLLRTLVRSDGQRSASARARMLREAQSMAQLHHPNVIAVHDVGLADDRVFIAMEFIEGTTLGEWVEREERPIDEVLDAYAAAGRGLAAAHAQGLIHRDFKPDNVLRGNDGRICVLDFGLARKHGGTTSGGHVVVPSESGPIRIADKLEGSAASLRKLSSSAASSITRTGAVMGTPAYMAPEQHLGMECTPASDQFSFCVALYEALYSERPFAGSSHIQIATSVAEGEIRDAPADRKVPSRLREVIVRGLSVQPEDRWEDMDALLTALAPPPPVAGRRTFVAVAGLGLVTVGALSASVLSQPRPCARAEERLDGIWDSTVQNRMKASFEATGKAFAADSYRAVAERLDGYSEGWLDAVRQTCEATHVDHRQSETVLDLRMQCLDRRLDAMGRVTGLLQDADLGVVTHAVDATKSIPGLDLCSDVAALQATVPPPDDPAARAEVERHQAALIEADALVHTERSDAAAELIAAALEASEKLDYAPLRTAALLSRTQLLDSEGRYAEAYASSKEAVWTAEQAGDDHRTAEAWIDLMWHAGSRSARFAEAEDANRHAEAFVSRLPPGQRRIKLDGDRISTAADTVLAQGHYEEAIVLQQQSIDVFSELEDGRAEAIANAQASIGSALIGLGRYEEALEAYEAALAWTRGRYGEHHPHVALDLTNVGSAHDYLQDHEQARKHHAQALEILTEAYGPDHPDVGTALNNLAGAETQLGSLDAAERHYARVEKIWRSAYGDRHPTVAMPLENRGIVVHRAGRLEEALALYLEAYALREPALGTLHPDVARLRYNLSEALRELGRLQDAYDLNRRALGVLEASPDPDRSQLGALHLQQARIEEARSRPDAARSHYRAVVEAWSPPEIESILDDRQRAALEDCRAKLGA